MFSSLFHFFHTLHNQPRHNPTQERKCNQRTDEMKIFELRQHLVCLQIVVQKHAKNICIAANFVNFCVAANFANVFGEYENLKKMF